MSSKNFIDHLDKISQRHTYLENELAKVTMGEEFIKLMKEFSELTPIVEQISQHSALKKQIAELHEMLQEPSIDADMQIMAMAGGLERNRGRRKERR